MKKEMIFEKVRLFFAPVMVLALGAVLLFNPDSASALIARILGWILGLMAIAFGIGALAGEHGRTGKVIAAIGCAVIGGWLGSHPLILAAWFGRIVGIVLLIDGVQDILSSRRQGTSGLYPAIVALIGLVLVLLPMTASRLIFAACGLVVLIVGVVMLMERLRGTKRLEKSRDSNIIDAL